MTLNVKRVQKGAKIPTKCEDGTPGWYIYSNKERAILPKRHVSFRTGIAIEVPKGTYAAIYPIDDMAINQGLRLCNGVTTIDENFREEIHIPFYNDSAITQRIKVGDVIGRLVLQPYCEADLEVVKKLEKYDG